MFSQRQFSSALDFAATLFDETTKVDVQQLSMDEFYRAG